MVGGGDSAVEEGMYLTQFADKVTVLVRHDHLKAQMVAQERAKKNGQMEFIFNTEVTEIKGDDNKVTGVKTHNNQTNEDGHIDADGVFVYVGVVPMTSAFKDLGILDERGWVKTDEKMATSVPGVYAVGDVRNTVLRQIATAVGDGAIAGQQIFNYISEND